MNQSEPVAVAMFQNHQEASIAQSTLEANGISAWLGGEVIADTMAYFGSATGGIRLMVAGRDAARAQQILEDIQSEKERADVGPGRCTNCGETVESGFDVCWSCGSDQIQWDAEVTEDAAAQPDMPDSGDTESPPADDEERGGTTSPSISRACRAAVLGVAFFPLSFYSAWLLLDAAGTDAEGLRGWKVRGALLIDAIVIITWVGAFFSMFF